MKIQKFQVIFIGIVIALAIMPFFWMKPGELDIGGDGTKMFYYDPLNFIRYTPFYVSLPSGIGTIVPQDYYLPFATLFVIFNTILHSPHLLNVFHISIKLVVGFLSVYGIVKEILFLSIKDMREKQGEIWQKVEFVAIITGLFYTFAPTIIKYNNYVDSVVTHDQVFL